MTRKDFELIADVIANKLGFLSRGDHTFVAESFADRLKTTNPNFDYNRFLKACNVPLVDQWSKVKT